VKNLYKENQKLLRKETEDYRRWKDLSCSWICRINTVKMPILPKESYMFNVISIKILMSLITEIKKSTLTFMWKHKRPWIVKAILSKKNNTGGITITDFKLYYRVIAIKKKWYWHQNSYEDQRNRIEDPIGLLTQ
jgi:hypothetical protein